MLKKWSIIIGMFFCLSNLHAMHSSTGVNHTVYIIEEMEAICEDLGDGDIALWDVDDTIITPIDHLMTRHKNAMNLYQQFSLCCNPEMRASMLTQGTFALVDSGIPGLISSLQKRNVVVMALTAIHPGPLGSLSSLEDWRIDHLRSFGIDFAVSFNDYDDKLKQFVLSPKNEENTCATLFKSGIIYSAHRNKAEQFSLWLDTMCITPKRVTFFEDNINNLAVVKHECERRGIRFVGVHCRGIDKHIPLQIDSDCIRLQIAHVLRTCVWLRDDYVQANKELLRGGS